MPRKSKPSLLKPCKTDDELSQFLDVHLGLKVPRIAACDGHSAPFDYLRSAYFEPARDLVVWAPRGGGKTRLAAAATLLDLLHKPGVSVRILGGSLDQSLRMWEHLMPDLERLIDEANIDMKVNSRRISLDNGSSAAVLTQSQRAVRGLRVQKLRCDEVELFKPAIWEAAQLVTRSLRTKSLNAMGVVEAISTLHNPWGLMHQVVEKAKENNTRIIRWCLLDVLERCEAERDCGTCALWDECKGIAKTRCDGYFSIDDAIVMKGRVSAQTWQSEMLCLRPNVHGTVFPEFSPEVHVREHGLEGQSELLLAIDFGFANPFVCLWVRCDAKRVVHVIDEYVQERKTMHQHIEEIRSRKHGEVRGVYCDPAGAGRNDQTAKSNIDVLVQSGFVVKSRASRIVDGVEMLRTALSPALGSPTLFIHPRCVRLIRALTSYRYLGMGEVPLKDGEHDHPIDALRYFYVNHFAPRGKIEWRGY